MRAQHQVFNSSQFERQNYEENGYCIIENFIPTHVCQALITRANSLVQEADLDAFLPIFSTKDHKHTKNQYFLESGDKIRFFLEEKAIDESGTLLCEKAKAINKIGHALHLLDPLFYCFSHLHAIMQLAEELAIDDPVILQSMYIFKQPHIGGEVNCHQDATFLYLHDQIVTGFWFALEDATIENGCLWGIPGGHKGKLKSRMLRKDDHVYFENYDETPFDLTKLVPIEAKQGSLVVLNGLFPHMSYENRSQHSRHAYTLHLASKGADYAEDNWLKR